MVSQELFNALEEETRRQIGEDWRGIVCRHLRKGEEEVEVLWLTYADALNAFPITLDVEFSSSDAKRAFFAPNTEEDDPNGIRSLQENEKRFVEGLTSMRNALGRSLKTDTRIPFDSQGRGVWLRQIDSPVPFLEV